MVLLWPDPEKTLRRPYDTAVITATAEAPSVPSDSAEVIPKVKAVFPVIPRTLVWSDSVKRLSGDPRFSLWSLLNVTS